MFLSKYYFCNKIIKRFDGFYQKRFYIRQYDSIPDSFARGMFAQKCSYFITFVEQLGPLLFRRKHYGNLTNPKTENVYEGNFLPCICVSKLSNFIKSRQSYWKRFHDFRYCLHLVFQQSISNTSNADVPRVEQLGRYKHMHYKIVRLFFNRIVN